jgi:hypothetical protein
MDLNKIPKQFCENITVAYSPEYFIIAMITGQNVNAYSLTPQHAKRLQQYLQYNIENFEKNFGEIKANWTPGVESPLQLVDLNKKNG